MINAIILPIYDPRQGSSDNIYLNQLQVAVDRNLVLSDLTPLSQQQPELYDTQWHCCGKETRLKQGCGRGRGTLCLVLSIKFNTESANITRIMDRAQVIPTLACEGIG